MTHPPNQVLTSSDSRLLDMVCTVTHPPNQVLTSVALAVGIWQSLTPICPHPNLAPSVYNKWVSMDSPIVPLEVDL